MEIQFLGTSATWPLPRKGRICECKICQSKDKRDKRLRSALLLTVNYKGKRTRILIDCGPDIRKQLKRAKISKIDAILLTHSHSDHISGIGKLQLRKINEDLMPIYALIAGHRKIKENFERVEYRKEITRPYELFKIKNLKFRALPVDHSKMFPTVAFEIISHKTPKTKRLIYMPDYKKVPPYSRKLMRNCQILILGGAILRRPLPWHKPITEGIELAKEVGAKKVYFTHIGHKTLPHKELVEFVQRKGGRNFYVAYDGLKIKI